MLSSQPMLPVEKRVGKCTANLLSMFLDNLQGTLSAVFVIKGVGFHTVSVPCFHLFLLNAIFFHNSIKYSADKAVCHCSKYYKMTILILAEDACFFYEHFKICFVYSNRIF